jgi:hypothetical protein
MRDTQRSKVYASDKALDTYGRLETVPEIERFIKKLWKSERFRKAFPKAATWWTNPPRVADGRGRRRAGGTSFQISMPVWSRTTGVVCHELAHTVHLRECQKDLKNYGAPHGWQYCSVYLRIVLYGMGREAHDTLKAAFKANRVKFREPRKRAPLSPERRAELAARLSVYRDHKNDPAYV